MSSDPICGICGEPKSAHVDTSAGPFTHPREARGEGTYELVREGHFYGSFFPRLDDGYAPPKYVFVPNKGA